MSATDSPKKAVGDYKKNNLEKQISQFRNLCESLLNSDLTAAGILDTITSLTGNAGRGRQQRRTNSRRRRSIKFFPASGKPRAVRSRFCKIDRRTRKEPAIYHRRLRLDQASQAPCRQNGRWRSARHGRISRHPSTPRSARSRRTQLDSNTGRAGIASRSGSFAWPAGRRRIWR